MSYHSVLLDKDFDSVQALVREEANEQLRREREGVLADDAAMRDIPIEQFRALCERGMRSDAEKMARAESEIYANVFTQLHPEYIDGGEVGKKNAATIQNALGLLGITTPNQQQLEDVYQRCVGQGLLHLDKKVLQQQYNEATRNKAEAWKAANTMPSEEEMYTMPLEELRRRGGGGGGW